MVKEEEVIVKDNFNKNIFEGFIVFVLVIFTLSFTILFLNNWGMFDSTERYVLISQEYSPENKNLILNVCSDLNCYVDKICPHTKKECECNCNKENILSLIFGNENGKISINDGMLINVKWRYIPKTGWRIRGVDPSRF